MGESSDEDVWRQVVAGDARAFGLIWDRHADRVMKHLLPTGHHGTRPVFIQESVVSGCQAAGAGTDERHLAARSESEVAPRIWILPRGDRLQLSQTVNATSTGNPAYQGWAYTS